MARSIMKRSKRHLLKRLERPRLHGKAYLIAAMVGLINIVTTVTMLLAAGPLF